MKRKGFVVLAFLMFVVTLATAQTRGVAQNAIPGDNNLRYYRLALPVTVSAFQQGYCQNEKISVAEFLKGFDKELTATGFQRFTLRAE